MTRPEIVAYVMALTPADLRRLSAADVMGWHEQVSHTGKLSWQGPGIAILVHTWRPDEDRNQSRMVTVRVIEICGGVDYLLAFGEALGICVLSGDWLTIDGEVQILRVMQASALDETRAALIAHMIHAEEEK